MSPLDPELVEMRVKASAEPSVNIRRAKTALWALDDGDAAKVVIERMGLGDHSPKPLCKKMRGLVARSLMGLPKRYVPLDKNDGSSRP